MTRPTPTSAIPACPETHAFAAPGGVAKGLDQFERVFILRLNDRSSPLPEDKMELLYTAIREGEEILGPTSTMPTCAAPT
jgi:hypothetical protein